MRSTRGATPAFGKDPLEVESFLQLIRRIQDPKLNFREALREHDMEFRIKAPAGTEILPQRPERFIPGIVQYLNAASIGQAIPLGRSLVILQEGGGLDAWRFALVKGSEGFECQPPLSRTGEGEEESAPRPAAVEPARETTTEPEAAAKPPSDPPQTSPRVVERGGAEEEARAIPLRAQSLDSLSRVLSLAARQTLIRGVSIPVLLESGTPRIEDLQALNLEGVGEISEGMSFRLFSAEGRRSFQGTLESGRLRWEEMEDKAWDHAAVFSTVAVRSVVELYQVLLAYSRTEQVAADAELTLRLRSAPASRDSLAEFLANTLDRHPLVGRQRLQVEFGNEEPPLAFRRGENGRWERE